jgi:hypothetical protein
MHEYRTAKQRDMNRHIEARHRNTSFAQPLLLSDPRHICPVVGCRYARDGFDRKDKLKRHEKVHARVVP